MSRSIRGSVFKALDFHQANLESLCHPYQSLVASGRVLSQNCSRVPEKSHDRPSLHNEEVHVVKKASFI